MSSASNVAEAGRRTVVTIPHRTTRWLALGAVAGPLLFNLAWLILGFVSPGFTIWGTTITPYSPISAGISGLGLGSTAVWMNGVFITSGLLVMIGAFGIFQTVPELSARARRACTVLLGLAGLGMIIDGIFTLESIMVHLLGFLLAVGVLVPGYLLGGVVLGRVPRWRRFAGGLRVGGLLTLGLIVLYFVTFSPTADGAKTGVAGLTERILVVEATGWLAAMGWLAFRKSGEIRRDA